MSDINLKLATPAERLKAIRKMARLTREGIEAKHKLPAATLKAWENGVAPITEKGLRRCIDVYRREGILLTREWVLDGVGLPPKVSVDLGRYFAGEQYLIRPLRDQSNKVYDELPAAHDDDAVCMVKEASYFKELYPDAVIHMVSDDFMHPTYQAGDYVGGRFRYGDKIRSVISRDCIIRLKSGEDIFRRVYKSRVGSGYNLACINPMANTAEPILFNVEIDAAAPIIWHRVPNNT